MMWDERYAGDEYAYGREPNDFLRRTADDILPGRVLCLAEGEGRNAVFLAQQGYEVSAVDQSAVGLQKAHALAADHNVEIHTDQADLRTYPIEPDSWDGIVSIFCHLPQDIRQPLHQRVVAGLKPGGALVLEAYHPAQADRDTGGPGDPALLADLDTLREELAGLNFQIMQDLERPVNEGRYHQGEGHVIQILAFKPR